MKSKARRTVGSIVDSDRPRVYRNENNHGSAATITTFRARFIRGSSHPLIRLSLRSKCVRRFPMRRKVRLRAAKIRSINFHFASNFCFHIRNNI